MADDKLLGHGPLRYRLDTSWSKADPAKAPVNDCHEMVAAPDGRLFLLTNRRENNVLIYRPDGRLDGTWTLGLEDAHGLSIDGEFLWITDTETARVVKTTLEGRIELELPHPKICGAYSANETYSPTETAIGPNGDVYVADGYGSQFILRYDRNGKYLGKFGGRSAQAAKLGKFLQVHGVALDTRGKEPLIVCAERLRNELAWFTLEGVHVRTVYLPGAFISRPVIAGRYLYSGICFGMKTGDYRMWQGSGFVTILDETDRVVSSPGGLPPVYRDGRLQLMLQDEPVFHNCHDVCVDARGDLYVCQWNSGQVYPYKLHLTVS